MSSTQSSRSDGDEAENVDAKDDMSSLERTSPDEDGAEDCGSMSSSSDEDDTEYRTNDRRNFKQKELPRQSQKWAAVLKGDGASDVEDSLKGDEALVCFSSVKAHQNDFLTSLEKLQKYRSVTLSQLNLTDGCVPAGLLCSRKLVHLDLSGNNFTSVQMPCSLMTLKSINLSSNSINVIPNNIKLFRNLEKLNLSDNKIGDLSLVSACTSLRMLWIAGNQLHDIPTEIGTLSELKEVNLSYNDITDITPIVSCTQLEVLEVMSNKIASLPAGLEKLTELKEVNLSYNYITDITPIVSCTQLEVLDVRSNKLASLPAGFEKLTELKEVNLSRNEITNIPTLSVKLKEPMEVDNSSKLVGTPAELEKLRKLKEVSNIPTMSEQAVTSRNRNEDSNESLGFRAWSEKLAELMDVGLSKMEITDTAPSLGSTQLQTLDVESNKSEIKAVDNFTPLEKLTELRKVDLSHNKITDITSIVGWCTKMQVLRLKSNKLVGLPGGLEMLTELKKLNVAHNKLSKLPEGICQLKKLTSLHIEENDIHQLPLHLDQCTSLTTIKWEDNPLTRPPRDVCRSGVEAIFQYFKDLRESECSVRKQQVVLLGETGAGKTSLALTLKDGKSGLTDESDRTHVLQKYVWDVNDDLKVNITDFGGHQVYELAHTFFLCSEVIALLAVDLSRYSNGMYHDKVGRWVNSILFMSPQSTVVVAGTHSDCCTKESAEKSAKEIATQISKQQTQMAEWVKSQLRNIEVKLKSATGDGSAEFQGYSNSLKESRALKRQQLVSLQSNIVQSEHVFVVSSSSLEGIPELQDALIRCCDRKAATLPGSWLSIQDRMDGEDIKAKLYIQYDEFCDIVHQGLSISGTGLPPDQSRNTAEALASYQHQCGGFLWFKEDPQLQQCVFHQPEVVVEFLKCVFHHNMNTLLDHDKQPFRSWFTKGNFKKEKKKFLQHGTVSSELLCCLVNSLVTDESMFETMVHLLEKFFLCFPMPEMDGDSRLLFPWFLTNEEPQALKKEKWLACSSNEHLYQVNFCFPVQCPIGFFERAVVLMYQTFGNFLLDYISWKDGVYLYKDDDRALFTRKREGSDVLVALALRGLDVTTLWPRFKSAYNRVVDLLKKWPGVLCDIQYLCPHCLASGQETPSWFPAEKLMQSQGNLGKYLPCVNSVDNRVEVNVVIPGNVTGAGQESTMLKTRPHGTCMVIEGTPPLLMESASALRDPEPPCQRGKDTRSGHLHDDSCDSLTKYHVAQEAPTEGTLEAAQRLHFRLLKTVDNHLMDDDFERLKLYCRVWIVPAQLERIRNTRQLLDRLQTQGVIEVGCYGELIDMLDLYDLWELKEKVEDLARKISGVTGARPKSMLPKSRPRDVVAEDAYSTEKETSTLPHDLEQMSLQGKGT